MHRDIKPENILFRTDKIFNPNQIVIADLGLATHTDVPEYLYGRCGTPGFVAPEIFHCRKPSDRYGVKCDLYSVGITFFYMVTGSLPYLGEKSLPEENREMKLDIDQLQRFSKEGFFVFNLFDRNYFFFYFLLKLRNIYTI